MLNVVIHAGWYHHKKIIITKTWYFEVDMVGDYGESRSCQMVSRLWTARLVRSTGNMDIQRWKDTRQVEWTNGNHVRHWSVGWDSFRPSDWPSLSRRHTWRPMEECFHDGASWLLPDNLFIAGTRWQHAVTWHTIEIFLQQLHIEWDRGREDVWYRGSVALLSWAVPP